jgi:hypothetical protein
MSLDIIFTNTYHEVPLELPKPAKFFVPEWYKNTDSYISGEKKPLKDNFIPSTIKRCMPVFDAINSGYIITLPQDIYVSQHEGYPKYQWRSYEAIQEHPAEQASLHPLSNDRPFPKFLNPWAIKTPKGYSCLFVTPMHHDLPFTILPGVVDTDKYSTPVNFVFSLNDQNFEGLIPEGTPIAQVIPFKRDNWKIKQGGEQELELSKKTFMSIEAGYFDRYKNMFRIKKEYN